MSLAQATRSVSITRLEGTRAEVREDVLAAEEPLEIRVGGHSVAVVMRTPGHDRELAAGFLVTEGILHRREEVLDMIYCGVAGGDGRTDNTGGTPVPRQSPDTGKMPVPPEARENILDVLLAPGTDVDLARLTRHVFTSSSCGICSKASIEAVRAQFPPIPAPLALTRAVIAGLPDKLRAAQAAFDRTGGLHASALFDAAGTLRVVREDVGRHNALDKVVGYSFFADGLPLADSVLLVSGRVSFEIMQKALAAGIPAVAAISAPTSAAVEFAHASGQMLVGFIRGDRLNVYAGTLAG